MRRSLYASGVVISLLYLGFMYWAIGDKIPSLRCKDLNEIGDFLAGVFSPLAFLWLVLGFIQQGIELRVSSESLKLQTEELGRSVAQQTSLANATERSLRNQELAMEPVFQLNFGGLSDEFVEGDRYEVCSFKLQNVGAPCEHVCICLMASDGSEAVAYNFPFVPRDGVREFSLSDVVWAVEQSELRVSYIKFNGVAGTQIFDLTPTAYSEPGEWYVAISKRILEI